MGKNKFNKKEVVSSYLIDGDGLVTIDFEYPYKVMVFVYNDGSVEKKIVNRYCFTEDDKFFLKRIQGFMGLHDRQQCSTRVYQTMRIKEI